MMNWTFLLSIYQVYHMKYFYQLINYHLNYFPKNFHSLLPIRIGLGVAPLFQNQNSIFFLPKINN